MGYTILPAQLKAIIELTQSTNLESIELLWLPLGILVVVWTNRVECQVIIDEDGVVVARYGNE